MKKCEEYCYIINIGSVYGKSVPFLPAPEQSHNVYNPTKFAVLSLTEVIRQELIKLKYSRIRISTVNPGLVETELYEMSEQSEEGASEMKKWPILKPEEIANGVLYILSTPYSVNVSDLTIKPVGERI
jgi:NADP+-dependent farnesol dehydrogenase